MPDLGCIFCGNPTGSREHLSLAALGSRRKNKGILCAKHNNHFSPLDQELAAQLAVFNGLIGVRSDYEKNPKKARVIDPVTGTKYEIDATGHPEQANPLVTQDVMFEGRRHIRATFSSQEQAQEWVAQMKKQGIRLKREEQAEGIRYLTKPVSIEFSLGGPNTMREVGRIVLNFLAHKFPELARHHGLREFKDFVLGNLENRFVWFDPMGSNGDLPSNKFPFGHRILIGFSSSTGEIYGRLSFFSTFDFALKLGQATPIETQTTLFDIDPLAEHPPHDVFEQSFKEKILDNVSDPLQNQDLKTIFRTRILGLKDRIETHHWNASAGTLASQLNNLRTLSTTEMREQIKLLLECEKQRMFHSIRDAAFHLKSTFMNAPAEATHHLKLLGEILDQFTAADSNRETGLSMQAEVLLDLMSARISTALTEELANGPIHAETLRDFIEGSRGATLGIELITEPFLAELQRRVED